MKKKTSLQKVGKIWMLSFMIMMNCSTVFALDPMGSPATDLRQGQLEGGIEYSHSTMDIKLHHGTWIEFFNGLYNDSGDATSFTLKDFEMNKVYFNLGYGFTDNLEAFFRIGAATSTFGDSIWEDSEKFDSDVDLTIGTGIKATFYDDGRLKVGGMFQSSWGKFDGKLDASHWPSADYVEINMTELQIAVGPTYKLTDSVSIYGGPFWHCVSGYLDDEATEEIGGDIYDTLFSWDIDDSSTFGAYIGTKIDFNENTSFNIEFQHTAEADAVVAGFRWRF